MFVWDGKWVSSDAKEYMCCLKKNANEFKNELMKIKCMNKKIINKTKVKTKLIKWNKMLI